MDTKCEVNNYLMQTYKRTDIVVKKGKGQYLWDEDGKKYTDFFSGISVCNLGHCNPVVNSAIKKQLDCFLHVSNLYYVKPQADLAKELVNRSFGKGAKVFLANSGSEANEGAIKMARKFGKENKTKNNKDRYEIITFKNSFHGRTLATLSATGQEKFHKIITPLVEKFVYAEFNDINSVKKLINEKTVAIMVEPFQCEGGMIPAKKDFLKELRQLCDKHNLLLIFDEVQCGMGRTGKLFAWQYYGVKPDIFTLAKSLANGLPLGAIVANKKLANLFVLGDHGSTFGGNPISCAAGFAVLKLMTPKLLKEVSDKSKYFIKGINELKKKYSSIKEIRNVGLLVGVELDLPAKDIVEFCLNKGLLINGPKEHVLRFLPSFVITKKDIDFTIKILGEAFKCQMLKK
ncbi:MAG: aspartate aminotransferase family protein [Endomicrobiia bacterium]|nr:aspartate aminotransferase family protein [Endomicrobiaceae bacterium]MDD3053271.1 aspartate aminotransferase family protein [Endomicrobiaceae bacterium]MDD3922374.1 aspartate aminotransferase family protein [Endomicrobiaceae bacterium]